MCTSRVVGWMTLELVDPPSSPGKGQRCSKCRLAGGSPWPCSLARPLPLCSAPGSRLQGGRMKERLEHGEHMCTHVGKGAHTHMHRYTHRSHTHKQTHRYTHIDAITHTHVHTKKHRVGGVGGAVVNDGAH